MNDALELVIDGAEAHVLEAALVIYRQALHDARDLGGPAQEAAALMDPITARVQAKLHDLLYGTDEAPEPNWLPEQADDMTAAKAAAAARIADLADGGFDIEGLPEFNGSFR